MPSRRRLRGPLHPRNRPPPSSSEGAVQGQPDAPSSSMAPPTSVPSGKKREWTATIGRGGLGSLPWDQMGPSSSGPPQPSHELPGSDFNFQSSMAFPTSTSTTSMASMASMPSSSSASSFASFRQQQTPMSSSPSSFRTAADADESSYSARNTIFSRGNLSAQAALRETSQALHDSSAPSEDPPRKRRRGLAGTIVDTALNAALYTGAAALTAYSLWSSWGQTSDAETQQHHSDAAPEADMGNVISQNKRTAMSGSGKELRMPPGGLEEPPPPYYEDHATPAKQAQELPQPSTPQSNSVRTRKVFVSSQRNRRRPTFQGSKTHRQSTPRKGLPDAFRSAAPAASPGLVSSSSQEMLSADTSNTGADGSVPDDSEDVDDDEDDEMLSRFEAKMNALIAEGQAALNSTPVLQESDLRDIDTQSPSLGIGLSGRASQRFASPFGASSPFSTPHQQESVQPSSSTSEVARSSSHPDRLFSASDSLSILPEPVKRTFASPAQPHSLRHAHSAYDFNFHSQPQPSDSNRSSPFVFGRPASPSSSAVGPGGSPSVRAAGRRMTEFAGTSAVPPRAGASPHSRIPRSTSTLQSRKSEMQPRPSPF